MADLSYLCQSIVAVVFVFSAFWKLRYRTLFDAVIAGGPQRLRALGGRTLGPLVATLEILIGLALLGYSADWFPGAAAAIFLIIFSLFLARADSLANGCGCWRPPQQDRDNAHPYLARNAVLLVLAVVGASGGSPLGTGARIALAAVSILPAILVMELPGIVDLVLPTRRPLTATANRKP